MHIIKKFNIADWFSFYRIIAVPILLLILWFDNRGLFTWMLLISYCTDMIDGFLARRLKITSARGSQLDSIGDQLTFVVGIAGAIVFEKEFILNNYIPILIGLSLYAIQMVYAFVKYGKTTAFHTYLAKASAITQGVFILWLLFLGPVNWLFYLMILLGVVETIEEITLIYLYDEWVSGVHGIYWAIHDPRRE